jgi:hypothetical protein
LTSRAGFLRACLIEGFVSCENAFRNDADRRTGGTRESVRSGRVSVVGGEPGARRSARTAFSEGTGAQRSRIDAGAPATARAGPVVSGEGDVVQVPDGNRILTIHPACSIVGSVVALLVLVRIVLWVRRP